MQRKDFPAANNPVDEKGMQMNQDTTFTGCTFIMGSQKYEGDDKEYNTNHYGLWIYNNGDVVVDGCSFVGMTYGSIKSTWNHYGSGADLTIVVKDTVKEVGSYTATVKLHKEVSVEVPFEVVAEEA